MGSHNITWGNTTAAAEASKFWHTIVARDGGFTIIVLQNEWQFDLASALDQ